PVFVADLDVVQREWCRMAVLRADGTPFCVDAAGDILNFIERIFDEGFEVFAGDDVRAFERVARVNGEDRFNLEVFAPLQKLKQAQAIGGPITPGSLIAGAVDKWASG